MILALNTATNHTTLYLLRPDGAVRVEETRESGRNLSSELLEHIKKLLKSDNLNWGDLTGVIFFQGPGSFTGLRIGVSVANAIAYAQTIPIVGVRDDSWVETGVSRLRQKEDDRQVVPFYGAPPNISKPKSAH